MIKNKKQSMIVIGAFIFILMLFTTTYAFFNYTRTGTANNIKTGKIYFNADQGNNTVTLSDLFPISVGENETITSSTPGVGSLKLHITGDTTYTEGIEYLIEAVEVTGNGQTTLPISIDISYAPTAAEQGQDPNVIGTADNDYFINRGGNTSRYKLLSNGSISEGEDILVGYIAPGVTGIDGELTILAYLNADNIAITDTYDKDEPETALNGTTTDWIDGRTIFTTEEWNALQATGVSFKIKATANDGTWVENPIKPICTRVTDVVNLHTETCSQNSDYCYSDKNDYSDEHIDANNIITYGNARSLGTDELNAGDAFDCDVNGNGIIDVDGNNQSIERFYYVSPYYDTKTETFDDTYATLIYYSNVYSGEISDNGAAYDSVNRYNWYGPVTAVTHLPTTSAWSNVSLKTNTRAILAENLATHNSKTTFDGTYVLPTDFSYADKAARLLTAQEVMNGCDLTVIGQEKSRELINCPFLFEGTKYANNSKPTSGIWLETPNSFYMSYAFAVKARYRSAERVDVYYTDYGVRPTIDVPVADIAK